VVGRGRAQEHARRDRRKTQHGNRRRRRRSQGQARLTDLGSAVVAASPAEFAKLIADETEKWAKVIRAANIKPD
jgi:hypothetical protein